VRRTVPFGLDAYSITVLWYTLHGHHPADAADRRETAPWYPTKTEPSLSDMLAKLRLPLLRIAEVVRVPPPWLPVVLWPVLLR
jgi:hypothetical protein